MSSGNILEQISRKSPVLCGPTFEVVFSTGIYIYRKNIICVNDESGPSRHIDTI